MRRSCFVLALLLLGFGTLSGRTDPAREQSAELYAESNVSMTMSFFGAYVAAEPHLVWRPSWFGLGVGAKLLAGTSQFDLHAAPFVRAELLWLYANAGWDFEMLGGADRYQPITGGPFVAAGIAPDLIAFGPGRLGIDAGIEAFFPNGDPGIGTPIEELVRSWDPPGDWAAILERVVALLHLKLGVLYTFPL
ncbi:MAG: hypothetical protein ACOCWX_01145 [Spirochaetota bacterium]